MPELSRENLEKQPTPSGEKSLYMEKIIEVEEELIEDSGKNPEEWIKENGKHFRKLITKNLDLLNDKEKLKEELAKKTMR